MLGVLPFAEDRDLSGSTAAPLPQLLPPLNFFDKLLSTFLLFSLDVPNKPRGNCEFHLDFNSSTKVIYLAKTNLRIKAKVKDLHKKDFYFKISASSRQFAIGLCLRSRGSTRWKSKDSHFGFQWISHQLGQWGIFSSLQKHSPQGNC